MLKFIASNAFIACSVVMYTFSDDCSETFRNSAESFEVGMWPFVAFSFSE